MAVRIIPAAQPANGQSAERQTRMREDRPKLKVAAYCRVSTDDIDQALSILSRTPGPISVTFVMADTGKALRAPERFWVSERVDLGALRALLGEQNVVMK